MPDVEPGVLTGTAASWSGLISVETSELGLPLSVEVDRSELDRDPADLAAELVRLCGQAANRARLIRRVGLADAGVPRDVLDRLGLATAEQIAEAEYAQETEYEYVPRTWRNNGGV